MLQPCFMMNTCVTPSFPPVLNVKFVNLMRHPLKTHFKSRVPEMKPFVGARLRPRFSKVSIKKHHCSLDAPTYSSFCKGNKSHLRHSRDLDDEVSQEECNIRFSLKLIRDMEKIPKICTNSDRKLTKQ